MITDLLKELFPSFKDAARETGDRRNVFWSRAGGPRFPAFPSRLHNVRGAMSSPAGRFLWTTEIVANAPVCTYDCVQPHQASFLLGLLQQGGSTCCNIRGKTKIQINRSNEQRGRHGLQGQIL